MPRFNPEQLAFLASAIQSQDYLQRVLVEIEALQRTVFHSNERADWDRARRSAEQILMTEIVLRHRGVFDRIYYILRDAELGGKPWDAAVRDLAASIHSYYTTPLGMMLRRDGFGEDVVFLSPDAEEWIGERAGPRVKGGGASP